MVNTNRSALKGHTALAASMLGLALLVPATATAQSGNALKDEIIVTATKSADGVNVKDAPLAVTAFGDEQLEALHVQDVSGLSYTMPNVQLDRTGTFKGVANFSIRGLGLNSSIPSIDPTVGVFVDGIYYGMPAGVVLDTFDLEAVEVLRGPQGILFGRNVTGGAVLMRTKAPTDEFHADGRVAVETGLNFFASGTVSGPVTKDGKIKAKAAVYLNEDEGYFTNLANGNEDYGQSKTFIYRGAVTFEPTDNFSNTSRFEHGDTSGDGPPSRNHGLFGRDNFDLANDEEGKSDQEWQSFTNETVIDVPFGEGTVTNIAGWREYKSVGTTDVDSGPTFLFHANANIVQSQFSNELRYNGSFGNSDITAGVFYFSQDILYIEQRLILGGALNITGGGQQDHSTLGVFAQVDHHLNDRFTINLGGRYSSEKKDVNIATIPLNTCDHLTASCSSFDFNNDDSWKSFAPKIGFQWKAKENTNVYGFWTKAFRSGGYNFRNTSPTASPGPFDQEEVSSFEVGVKTDFADGKGRFNLALFNNSVSNMQREVGVPDPIVGVIQIIRNTADASLRGFEADVMFFPNDHLTLFANVGHVDGQYDTVLFDISGDGNVDAGDLALSIPRLSPWSYGFGAIVEADTAIGNLSAQATYGHRDQIYITDNNLGFITEASMVDANVTLTFPNQSVAVSLYGKNLLDESKTAGDFPLPFFPGSTLSPANKGKIIGVELKAKY